MTPLVFSLNPAVDVEWRVEEILAGEKNELRSESRWPGGKGVNVARWLSWLRKPPRLFVTLGGATGRELAAGLRKEGIRTVAFRLREPTRVNVVVTPDRGEQLRFNPSWPHLDAAESRRLGQEICRLVLSARTVVISGTLAFGAPAALYARLVRAARRGGCRVFLDCDREPFALAVRERPFLVKPNQFELAQWAGTPLPDEASEVEAAGRLSKATGGWVLVSRGEKGALLVHQELGVVHRATVPASVPRNTVGAGDALLAGVVAAVEAGKDPEDWLRDGVATGTAATTVAPGQLPSRKCWNEILRSVAVHPGTTSLSATDPRRDP